MLLAVKAKRVTFTSKASSGSAAASGSDVSITLHCCRSLRATIKSVEGIGSIPVLYMQQSLRRPMTLLQQQLRLKRCFGLGSMPPRHCLRQTRSVCARERSDEAIHTFSEPRDGLLRFARNDELSDPARLQHSEA